MKKIFKITFGVLLLFTVTLYLGIVFVLPSVINSKFTVNKIQSLIYNKTGAETDIMGLNLKISPKFVLVLNVDNIDARNNNVSVIDIKNLSLRCKLLKRRLTLVSADNIFVDGNYLKQFKKEGKKENRGNFEPNNIPEIHIKKIVFNSDKLSVHGENIDTNDNILTLKAAINAPFLKETLKLGNSGSLQVAENELRANKFKISLGNSHLYIDGTLIDKNKTPDFNIKGENLPASEIMPMILHLQKAKDPSRKFIQNFKNFGGTANVNLKFNKDGLFGTCVGNELRANAIWFDIPLYFKEAIFNFRGQTVDSVAVGILGNERVVHTLDITDLFNPQKKLVVGTMDTNLTPKFNFVPNLTILNSVHANLIYKIKDKKPDVYYNIDIPVGSDLIYNAFYLGMKDYKRKIYGNTLKVDNDLYLRKYKYSYFDSGKENIIISGDGLFMKQVDKSNPDKFVPQYLTIRTNGYAPTSVIGSFGEKVKGGKFKGDLKYDFRNDQILGTFDIIEARHKAFHIENAHVTSQDGVFNITSNGTFKGERYFAELNAKNNIFGETLIYDMKLFLDKLIIKTESEKQNKKARLRPKDISRKVQDADITINNWEILINEIRREKFVLEKVKLIGSMKNNIFDFNMNQLNFADGVVRAKGVYNFADNTSKMTFEAKDINSNKAANMMLNLQDQIEGTANAKVDLSARDMFEYLDAHCWFEVKEGFLPKLGDAEFTVKNSKYKLSQIINYDLAQRDEMQFDIKGAFDVHDTEIKNVDIKSSSYDSAMYLEGTYEMEKQYADLQLFWKYSKESPKGIRVFHIPLSFILKVVFRPEHSMDKYQKQFAKVPAIDTEKCNTNHYRVHLNGDINNNKVNLILKEVR